MAGTSTEMKLIHHRFYLYRLLLHAKQQGNLFSGSSFNADLLTAAVTEKRELKLRKPAVWRMGRAKQLSHDGDDFLIYCFGRTTDAAHNICDEDIGDYTEEILSDANFTHVVFDFKHEVCAVAKNNSLAYELTRIVQNLTRILNSSLALNDGNAVVILKPIPDTKTLFNKMDEAGPLVRFRTTIRRPNPIDVDAKLHDPIRQTVEELKGENAKLESGGKDLDKEVSKELLSSTMASGETVKVGVRDLETNRIVSHYSQDDHASFSTISNDTGSGWSSVVLAMRNLYEAIRAE